MKKLGLILCLLAGSLVYGSPFDPIPLKPPTPGWLWEPTEPVLNLTFTGDIMAHNTNYLMKDYKDIYKGIQRALASDDLSFANFEFPMDDTKPNASYPQFNVSPSYGEAAILAGFDGFTLANNHSNDQGKSGILRTIRNMKAFQEKYQVVWSGLKETPGEPMKLQIFQKQGLKIGFVGITNILNAPVAKEYIYAPFFADIWGGGKMIDRGLEDLLSLIRNWKAQVDLLIVGIHDGIEYVYSPREYQKVAFRKMAEAGVDIVWGNHPHVVLPWEKIEVGGQAKLIIYSLGNFISGMGVRINPQVPMSEDARTGDGVLLKVQVKKTRTGVRVQNVEPLWTNNFRDPVKGMIVGFTETLAQTAPGVWKGYYAQRLKAQKRLEQPWPQEKSVLVEGSPLIRFN